MSLPNKLIKFNRTDEDVDGQFCQRFKSSPIISGPPIEDYWIKAAKSFIGPKTQLSPKHESIMYVNIEFFLSILYCLGAWILVKRATLYLFRTVTYT